ncbi:MAG: hypothetical protein N2376_00775 [Clostridia bacterium]|nr:hypothetical protein [Clostridia bacterium]
MPRRRYISTEISVDKKVNRLAKEYGDFAALLYTWMLPHAEDNCELTGDPEEILSVVIPGRRDKTEEDVKQAILGMIEIKLVHAYTINGSPRLFFPPKNFYKFQTYISRENRDFRNAEDRAKSGIASTPDRNEPIHPNPANNALDDLFQFFKENIGAVTPFYKSQIAQWEKAGLHHDLIKSIMEASVGKRNPWDWLKKVAEALLAESIFTMEQYLSKRAEMQRQKVTIGKAENERPARRNNFQQRQYDDAFYELLGNMSVLKK